VYVRHLSVTDFRSWAGAELELAPGVTALIGPNGQGKTNLIEALGYLGTLSSHRVAADAPLVRRGADRAVVRAAVVAAQRELRVEVEITPGRATRARLNGAPRPRVRDILGAVRSVLFAPEDLAIVRGDPSERRRFLDELATARTPRIAGVRADYERVLRQRSALLKSAGAARRTAGAEVAATLDVWDGALAAAGSELLHARLEALRDLAPYAAEAYAAVAPASAALHLRYSTVLERSLPELGSIDVERRDVPEVGAIRVALLEELARARPSELERGVNLVGPHRDDLDLAIGALPVRGYASHGEGWSVALALRLGMFELLRRDDAPGAQPVLVLDDVFAELDSGRRAQLAKVAATAEQTLVTAAVDSDVPAELAATRLAVRDGTVSGG
jgi:DNA replication and repair protein RecF